MEAERGKKVGRGRREHGGKNGRGGGRGGRGEEETKTNKIEERQEGGGTRREEK
jgi:hypothetical protein